MSIKIGILSDSHGRIDTTGQAIAMLADRGATCFIHLGDVETPEVIEQLAGYTTHLVFGNCDWDTRDLRSTAESLDIIVDHPAGELTIDDRVISFTHGHLPQYLDAAIGRGVDYLLHGHTHEVRDEVVGRTRIINPGALFRALRYTAALLEPASNSLDIIEISRGDG